jgi:hypothetical protein
MPTDTTGPSLGGTDQARTSTEECERLVAAFRRFIRSERETSPADPDTLVDLHRGIAGDRTTPEITVRLVVGPERADPGRRRPGVRRRRRRPPSSTAGSSSTAARPPTVTTPPSSASRSRLRFPVPPSSPTWRARSTAAPSCVTCTGRCR